MSYIKNKYQDHNNDTQDFLENKDTSIFSGNYSKGNAIAESTEWGDNIPNWKNWKNYWEDKPEKSKDFDNENSDDSDDSDDDMGQMKAEDKSDDDNGHNDDSTDDMGKMKAEDKSDDDNGHNDDSSDDMGKMKAENKSDDDMGDTSHGHGSTDDMGDTSHGHGSTDDMSDGAGIISSSDAGIPLENPDLPPGVEDGNDIDKLDFGSQYTNPNGMDSSDNLSGTEGANTFKFDLLLNAKPEIYQKHLDGEGRIDWKGVTGENGNYHDHWMEGIGQDTIMDFSGTGGEGDKIQIDGHTVTVKILEELNDQVTLGLYADQGADGTRGNDAHDFDVLGKITINHDGNFNYGSDVSINAGSHAGAFEFA